MGILNRPSDGLSSVLVALYRTLRAYGPLPADRLLALAAPRSVIDDKADYARKTLTRWSQLGLFVPAKEDIALASGVDTLPPDDIDALRRATLALVLTDANNEGLASHSADPKTERPLASDFTRAVCWALAQDPYSLGTTYHSDPSQPTDIDALQRSQCAGAPIPFQNDTRWAGFVDWALFLGFGWKAPKFLINPFFAVSALLPDVFQSERELPIEVFLGHLASKAPVFDGGAFRQTVDGSFSRPPTRPGGSEISPSLSLALAHLEGAGLIRLEPRSDATIRTLTGRRGRELRGVSHVVLTGQA